MSKQSKKSKTVQQPTSVAYRSAFVATKAACKFLSALKSAGSDLAQGAKAGAR